MYTHQIDYLRDVTVVHNTIYTNTIGLYIKWGGSTSNMIFSNNAIYSPLGSAIVSSGVINAEIKNNYIQGKTDFPIDNAKFFDGGNIADQFVAPDSKDMWLKPGSILKNKAATSGTVFDFDENERKYSLDDIGAYSTSHFESNPGFKITTSKKGPSIQCGDAEDTISPQSLTAGIVVGVVLGFVSLLLFIFVVIGILLIVFVFFKGSKSGEKQCKT